MRSGSASTCSRPGRRENPIEPAARRGGDRPRGGGPGGAARLLPGRRRGALAHGRRGQGRGPGCGGGHGAQSSARRASACSRARPPRRGCAPGGDSPAWDVCSWCVRRAGKAGHTTRGSGHTLGHTRRKVEREHALRRTHRSPERTHPSDTPADTPVRRGERKQTLRRTHRPRAPGIPPDTPPDTPIGQCEAKQALTRPAAGGVGRVARPVRTQVGRN